MIDSKSASQPPVSIEYYSTLALSVALLIGNSLHTRGKPLCFAHWCNAISSIDWVKYIRGHEYCQDEKITGDTPKSPKTGEISEVSVF
jgi:hypothetical protein